MKNIYKIPALAFGFALLLSVTGCSDNKATTAEPTDTTTTSIAVATTSIAVATTTNTPAVTTTEILSTTTVVTTTLAPATTATTTTEPAVAPCDASWTTDAKVTAGWPGGSGIFVAPHVQETARIGAHDGYDRWVLEFRADSTPPAGWEIAWNVGPVLQDGSGFVADIDGTEFLSIRMLASSGWALPEAEWYAGPTSLMGADVGASNLVEAKLVGDYEGYSTWGIGVDHQAPFNVFTLSNPSRLVIDICH